MVGQRANKGVACTRGGRIRFYIIFEGFTFESVVPEKRNGISFCTKNEFQIGNMSLLSAVDLTAEFTNLGKGFLLKGSTLSLSWGDQSNEHHQLISKRESQGHTTTKILKIKLLQFFFKQNSIRKTRLAHREKPSQYRYQNT